MAGGLLGLIFDQIQRGKENRRAEENAATQRMYAQNQNEREAAREYRERVEFERRQKEDEEKKVERRAAQIPMLLGAVKSYGPDVASQMGAPYGVSFNQPMLNTLHGVEEGPEQNPAASAARFLMPNIAEGPPELSQAQAAGMPEYPGMEMEAPPPPERLPVPMPEMKAGPLQMRVGTQSMEVTEAGQGHGITGLGEKYDEIYQAMRASNPEVPAKALLPVIARMAVADEAEGGRNTRAEDSRTAKTEHEQAVLDLARDTHLTVEQKQEQFKKLLANQIRVAEIRSAQPEKVEASNDRAMSLLERRAAAVRQTTQFAKLAAQDKTVRGLFDNIADDATPLQHKDAQIQLARFFRQAQPTEGEMHILYSNLGGTMDKWNQFVAKIETGDLSAEQMRQLKASAVQIKKEHGEDLKRFQNVAQHMLGPKSGFGLMPDQAQEIYAGLGAELGLENLPSLFESEGGMTVGSRQTPKVTPKSPKAAAAHTVHMPDGSVRHYDTTGKRLD